MLFVTSSIQSTETILVDMAKSEKKRGPKDKRYVNRSEKHEVNYEKKRKQAARKFGESKEDA
jgi:hypothetical protein